MTREEAVSIIEERIHVTEYVESSYVDCVDIEALRMVIKALEQPEQRWIPVTERPPEDGERVLATHLGGIYPDRQVIEHVYKNGKFLLNWNLDLDINSPTFGQSYMGEIIAWMPLPKPYQEEGEQDEQAD